MHWYDVFAIWYIGCFLIGFGVLMVWKGQAISSCRRFFYFELRDPQVKDRFSAVVARRNELEGDNTFTWRLTGYCAIFFGALVLFKAINPVIGYALLCADLAVIMASLYSRMRNRGERRAASLNRRSVTTSVPALWFASAIVSSLLPLALWNTPGVRGWALLVTVACLVIVYLAAQTSTMAALLAGDDPDIEVYVDNRLRWSRVVSMLSLAYAVSYVFIAMSTPRISESPPMLAALQIVSSVLVFAFALWTLIVFFRGRYRMKAMLF